MKVTKPTTTITIKQSIEAAQSALNVRLAESGILRAGVDVFSKLGFATTRVEDILEAAGVARRTFYKYFGSKEDVLAAIYDLATGELTTAVQTAAAAAGDRPLDAMTLALDAYLDFHVANAALLRVLVQEALRSDSPLAARRRTFRDGLIILLDAAVRVSTGEEHDRLVFTALISAVEGVSLELLTSPATKTKDVERAKAALHLILERTLARA